MDTERHALRRAPAHLVLPAASAVLLTLGAIAAGLHGGLPADGVLAACAAIVLLAAAVSSPSTTAGVAAIGWLTTIAFSSAPYGVLSAQNRPVGLSAVVLVTSAVIGMGVGATSRGFGITLDDVVDTDDGASEPRRPSITDLVSAVDGRRRRLGIAVAIATLTLLTLVLSGLQHDLNLADDLLIYLLAVVAVAVVGGFGPAVLAAAAASLCLNWFFTPPLHTLTIEEPRNLLALLLFILVAMSVSSVVHVAARRATLAARSAGEAHALLGLARTVLGANDTPGAVLAHLNDSLGVNAELQERVSNRWIRIANSGDVNPATARTFLVRSDLRLLINDDIDEVAPALLEAASRLAAASLDRERLRTQASQSEALEAGNRMRTALLAAVSHDLRTPLASIKASISSLRQPDVAYSEEDEKELLATVEDSADRLDGLIANLLDMSRLQTGALQPFVQPVAVEEVAPLALHGLPGANTVRLDIPEGLPLLRADAGLLERALANLLSNALRYSPIQRPPMLRARNGPDGVEITVIDHGPGVVATQRQTMFEPFQRLGDHDTATGIGLGLAVARGFTEVMAGTLVASETPGGGLTMTVTLPTASDPAKADAPRSQS
jgi:two-component system, OmpR family, sensor histidine kinase KdpD